MKKVELKTLVDYFDDAETESFNSRAVAENCRDFYDGYQLDKPTRDILKQRGQPEVVNNLIQPKVDFLLGYEKQTRTDPKAYPRTPEHDKAADAATDGIRFVLDKNEFDDIASKQFEHMCIEGTGGCAVEAEVNGDDIDIIVRELRWDRLFIDPYSYRADGSDARYMGYVSWKDIEDAKERWPKAAKDLDHEATRQAAIRQTFDDKPTHWWSANRKRVMCVDIYFIHEGDWHRAMYTKGVWLEEPKLSPYLDEDGIPANKFHIASAKVDRDGQRYGVVKNDIDMQKEVNARRSKTLHLLNTRQTFGRDGAIADIDTFKREANKSDGHLTYPGSGQFGKDFGIVPNEQLVGPQFDMYQEAKQSLDMSGANAALQGTTEKGLSGKAIRSLQQGGLLELAPLFDTHSRWKKQVYRAVWNMIRQYWTAEKWVRVTDEEDNLKWVGLNIPMTQGEKMLKEQTGLPLDEIRKQFAQELLQVYAQAPEFAETVIENDVAELDVDIILEEVPDVINLQSEQFELLVKMYQANPKTPDNPDGVDWEDVVFMSTLRNKDRILGKDDDPEKQQMAAAAQQQAQQQQQIQQGLMMLEAENKQADTLVKQADAEGKMSKKQQTDIESAMLLTNPPPQKVAII